MQRKIKCGVIGAGWWATFAHIPALLSYPKAELVAIQSSYREEAKKVADDFEIPLACATVEELLAIDGLEAVVVSSTPNLHYEHAAAALAQGKHVLVEKPMTLTASQARRLVEIARKNNCQFLISCPWHYTSHAAEAQRLIQSGKLGDVRMISALMTNPISHLLRGESTQTTHGKPYMSPHAGTYSDPAIAGGGQIYTQVCHVAAYLTFLTGAWPAEVFARFQNDGAQLDIYDTVNLKMTDGCVVSIASTGATNVARRNYEVRVFGTTGILFLELWQGKLEFVPMTGDAIHFPNLAEDEIYPHQAPAHNLIDSVLDPSCNRSPAMLGVAAMDVIEAACRSAASDSNIRVASLLEPTA